MDELVELIEGDALKEAASLPDDSFDLIITSPPYNIGKSYEKGLKLEFSKYIEWQDRLIALLIPKLKSTASVCWQIGNYINDGEVHPLDVYLYDSFKSRGLKLRNRIIWHFNFGLHSTKRFSGRYETILWFTKTDEYKFNLDPVRIPQLYPGKRHSLCKIAKAGQPSGNPLGKNPSDYWEFSAERHFQEQPIWNIPNVKANHPEKTIHPCQYPVELVERCVLAFTDVGDRVLDPFVGTGASAIAALKHNRHAVGIDKEPTFLAIAQKRVADFRDGRLRLRNVGMPPLSPKLTRKVARIPDEWGAKDS